jgi:hypothetical protein
MPEITPKRRGDLVRGVFKLLLGHPDGLPAKTILEELQQAVPPTAFEQTTYPRRPDIRRYEKIVRFSTIAQLKPGGLLRTEATGPSPTRVEKLTSNFPTLSSLQKKQIGFTGSGIVSSPRRMKSRWRATPLVQRQPWKKARSLPGPR